MNEYQRMQYLDAMGVDTFVPRFILPNAKTSIQYQRSPEPMTNTAAPSSAEENASVSLTNRSGHNQLENDELRNLSDGLHSVLSALAGNASSTAKPSPALEQARDPGGAEFSQPEHKSHGQVAVTEQVGATQNEMATFDLGLWFIDSGIQIVDSRESQDALPTDTLLANILIFTGFLNAELPPMEVQKWPIPGVNLDDQSRGAASAMMHDFLSVRFEKQPARAFFLFGEDAYRAICGKTLKDSGSAFHKMLYKSVDVAEYNSTALVLPALRDHLYQPQMKRHLWSAIQPFSRGLV